MKVAPIRLLHEFLIKANEYHSEKTAIIVNNYSYTYKELYEASLSLATALQKNGAKS